MTLDDIRHPGRISSSYDAVDRGCHTASLQSTQMAERVFATLDSGISDEFWNTRRPRSHFRAEGPVLGFHPRGRVA
jgi:hypothetical protein